MKIIGLEEHYWTPEVAEALKQLPPEQRDDSLQLNTGDVNDGLLDLGEGRLRQMDLVGLDRMVLSLTTPATQPLPPAQAVALARQVNDRLAAAVRAHPDRLSGFATLSTPDPAAAAQELTRCVQELGFCGTLLCGRTGDKYLDHADFHPLLAAADRLNVPIYLHPEIPPRSVRDVYYSGFGEELDMVFSTGGWGWHLDTAVTVLRLILAGTFDRYPNLQFILGHWGEMVAFYLQRADIMSTYAKGLQKSVVEYYQQHFYLTGSGIYHTPYLLEAIQVMGIDRIMYSTDYPFQYHSDGTARHFLENAPLSDEDKAKIAYRNAERLLKLA